MTKLVRFIIRLYYSITKKPIPFNVVMKDPVLFKKCLFNKNTLRVDDIVCAQSFTDISCLDMYTCQREEGMTLGELVDMTIE